MARLAQRVGDRRLLVLIGRLLRAKVVLPDGGLERFIGGRLRLKINRDKSAVARPEDRHLLGFCLRCEPQPGAVEVLLSQRTKRNGPSRVSRRPSYVDSVACNLTLLGRGSGCSPAARRSEPVGRVEPGGVDALGVVLLELDRRDVADRGVQAVVVEPAHPLDDRQLCLLD
jgi:hypothetical protein